MQDTTGYGIIEPNDGDEVGKLIEKPAKRQSKSNLVIVGCYSFSPKIFDAAKQTQASSKTGEIELTDAIQNLIERGEKVRFVTFNGGYIDTGKL
jgi:glucose-1-phosphate thymidylyltransferase